MRKKKTLIILAAVLVAVVVVVIWPEEREPEYQGKKLSEWLEFYFPDKLGYQEAIAAIQHMGTNALPYLLRAITYQRSPSRKGMITAVQKMPIAMVRHRLEALAKGTGEHRAFTAQFGFRALGPVARPAVPELTHLLDHTNRTIRINAIQALGVIGREGLPPLMTVLANKHYPSRGTAAFWITRSYVEAKDSTSSIPFVLECLRDDAPEVVVAATLAIPKIEADLMVPALLVQTANTNRNVREVTIEALGEYRTNARSALPALLSLCNDPDARVRRAATNSLRKIAPEMLEGK